MAEPGNKARRWASFVPELDTAMAQHRAGRLDRAEALYRKVLARVADHPDALHMLGVIATSRGRPQRAVQLLEKVIKTFPDLAEAHLNLGNAYVLLGNRAAAGSCYRRAVALKPGLALAHMSLGRELNANGDFLLALASCRLAASLDPGLAEAHANLALAARSLGRLDEAERAAQQALHLKPDNLLALRALVLVLTELSRFDEARRCQERIVALRPEDSDASRTLAVFEFRTGDTRVGVDRLRGLVARDANYADGWTGMAWALQALGRFDEARECFQRALAIDPGLAEAHRGLAALGGRAADKAEIDRLRKTLAAPGFDTATRVGTGFALGSLLDRAERVDEAFACFAEANALERERLATTGRGYDAVSFSRRIDRLIDTFTPEFFGKAAGIGRDSELPVFVVGMPRSGTTLVEQIAASHPCVFGAGELAEIGHLAASLLASGGAPSAVYAWSASARPRAEAHLALLRRLSQGAARVIDKQPDNILHLGVVAALFPGARVVFCERDPRDICLSSYFQLFAGGNSYSYNLAECADRCFQIERLARHWHLVLPLRILRVGYEGLVIEPEAEARRLIEFLGLEWEPACLEFYRTERTVLTPSSWQVRQPLYRHSIGRWRRYRRHLQPVLEVFGG